MNSDLCLADGTETRKILMTAPRAKRFRARKLLSMTEGALQYRSISRSWLTMNGQAGIGVYGLGSHERDLRHGPCLLIYVAGDFGGLAQRPPYVPNSGFCLVLTVFAA